jgi:hypothetical protein
LFSFCHSHRDLVIFAPLSDAAPIEAGARIGGARGFADQAIGLADGDGDQIVPIGAAGLMSAKIVKGAILKIYPGAPHGLPITLQDKLNADLLGFIKG